MPKHEIDTVSAIIAAFIFVGGPLLGVVLCAVALRRRATNRRCSLALLFALASWACVMGVGMLIQKNIVGQSFSVVGIGFAALCFTASYVCAVIGLVQCVGHPQRYDRGRKRAITALVLNSLLFGVCSFTIYAGVQRRKALLAPLATPTPKPAATVQIGNMVLHAPEAPSAPTNVIKNEAYNFRLEPPPSWNAISATPFGPNARSAAARLSPEMYSMVLTESFPALNQMTPQDAMGLVKKSLEKRTNAQVLSEHAYDSHGMSGWWMESSATTPAGELHYTHWLTLSNGTLYRIVTWARPSEASTLRSETEKLVAGFHLIDPNHNTLKSDELAQTHFVSDRFGYTVDLGGTNWVRRFHNLSTNVPAAEYGVTNATGATCFVIVPVWIGDDDLDLNTLTHALAFQVGVPYPDDAIYGEKDWAQGMLHGKAFAYEAQRGGMDFVYRLRVLRGHGFAYLLATWMDKKASLQTDQLELAMDRVSFASEVAPNPELKSDRERETQMLVDNSIGLALDRVEQSEAAKIWFKRGFEMTHRNATLLTNYVQSCFKNSQPAEALAVLDQELSHFSGNQKLAAYRALAQMETGDMDGSIKSYAELFDKGWRSDIEFTAYIRELCNRKRADDALAALDRYSAGHESATLNRLRGEIFIAKGDSAKALETLTALRDKNPNDQDTALALVDTYLGAHRLTDALAECDRLIAAQHESVEVLRRKGLAEFALKHYREAKATLEKALAKAPTNLEIQRLLEGLSGLLGQGRNTAVKTPIEPVKIPAPLLQTEDADPADEYIRGYSAWYRCVVKAVSYHRGKEFKTTEHEVIQIRDQQGVEKFSTLQFPFDPLGEEVFVNDVTVKDATGKILSQGKVDDSYVVDDGVDKSASQAKVLNVPVPGLQPGNTLEYTLTRRETGQIKAFTFETDALIRSLPVLRSTLIVQAPHEDIHWESTPGLPAPQKEDGSLSWSVRRPAVYRWEPLQAPLETFVPMVWIGDANATWTGEAKDYLTQIKDRMAIDTAVRSAAEEVTKGLTSPAEKIAALTRYVQRGLTYKAIEFGRRARIPNPSEQTLRNKYGDCKDHALLLAQLLECAGIPAEMALVRSTSALKKDLPSLDQFNHAITFVPGEKGGTFIDATDKSGDYRNSPPLPLAGQQALVLDPRGAHLQTIPPLPPDGSTITTHRQVSFSNESDLKVDEDVVFTGTPAEGLRALLLAMEPPQRITYLQRMISGEAPSLNLRDAKFDALDDPHVPLHVQLHYSVAGEFHPAGNHLTGVVPAIWERLYVSSDAVENRFSPFKLWDSTHLASTVEFTPPPGWHASVGKGSSLKNPYCEATLKETADHDLLRSESQLTQHAGQFPANQYSAYIDAIRQSRALTEQSIVLEKKK